VFSASILVFLAITSLIIGIRIVLKRDIAPTRFAVTKNYNPGHDYIHKEENIKMAERQKPKIPLQKKIVLIILGLSVSFVFAFAVTGSILVSLLLAIFGGYIFPRTWLSLQLHNNVRILNSQLEQAAETMSMVIRTGGSIISAIDKATLEIENPFKRELEKTSYELKLGKPEAEALQDLAERVKLPELEMLAVASQLQREGMSINMATILNNIQNNIRIRQSLEEETKSLTAENRMAVWIVAAMPFVMLSIMRILAPDLTYFLFNTFAGVVFTIISFIVILIGVVWALKIAQMNTA